VLVVQDKKLPLHLSGLEVVHLTDAIRNTDFADAAPGKEPFVSVSRDLLRSLGSCYLELVHLNTTVEDGPVTIYVSEDEAWVLRTKAKTTDVGLDGKTFIGAGLLIKLYALILDFTNPELNVSPEYVDRAMTAEEHTALSFYTAGYTKENDNAEYSPTPSTDTNADD